MSAGAQVEPPDQFTVVVMLDIDMTKRSRKGDAFDEAVFSKTAELQIGVRDEEIFVALGAPIAPAEGQTDQGDIEPHEADDRPGAEIPEEKADREVQCGNDA